MSIDYGFIHDKCCEWFDVFNKDRTESQQYELESLCQKIAHNEHRNFLREGMSIVSEGDINIIREEKNGRTNVY